MHYIAIPGLKSKRSLPRVGRPETNEERAIHILNVICNYYGITDNEIKGSKRFRRICQPRHMLMYLIHKTTSMSLRDIGLFVGGRDHTSAMYARENIENLMQTDSLVKEDIAILRSKI